MEKLTFKNDEGLRQFYLDRIIAHEKADEIIQGVTWEKGKGCAVGCTLHSYDHKGYEYELELPEWVARLEDVIFEGLPNSEAKTFPREYFQAIKKGIPWSKLDTVKWKFCAFLIEEGIERVSNLQISKELKQQVIEAQKQVLAVHTTAIETNFWDANAASAAESAASAARNAASAAESAASAAESAASAARNAARSAESADSTRIS